MSLATVFHSHTIKQMAAKHCKHWIVLHEGGVLSMIFFYYFFVYQFTVLLVSKWGDREVIWHNMDVKVQEVLDFHNSWYFFSLQWKYRTRFRVKTPVVYFNVIFLVTFSSVFYLTLNYSFLLHRNWLFAWIYIQHLIPWDSVVWQTTSINAILHFCIL